MDVKHVGDIKTTVRAGHRQAARQAWREALDTWQSLVLVRCFHSHSLLSMSVRGAQLNTGSSSRDQIGKLITVEKFFFI